MLWCRATFQREFDNSMCRLFSTQKQLFEFVDAEAEKQRLARYESVVALEQEQWHLFSIEFPSEDEVAQRLSHSSLHKTNKSDDDDDDRESRNEELLHWQLFTERHKFRPHATLLASPSKQIKTETKKVNQVFHISSDDDDDDTSDVNTNVVINEDHTNYDNDCVDNYNKCKESDIQIATKQINTQTESSASHKCVELESNALEVKRTWGAPRKDFIVWYGEHSLSTQTRFFLAATRCGLIELHKRLPPLQRHLYEIIRDGLPCHVYLDVERTDDYSVFKTNVDVVDVDENINWDEVSQTSKKKKEQLSLQKMEEEFSSSQESVCLISDDDENDNKVKETAMNESKGQSEKESLQLHNKLNQSIQKVENNPNNSAHKNISITAYMAQGTSYNSVGGSSSEKCKYQNSVQNYSHTIKIIPKSAIPAHSCPLTCHVTPDNSQTERVLLRELALFVQSQYPQLTSHFLHEVSAEQGNNNESNNVEKKHNWEDDKSKSQFVNCTFAEVMVMRSLPMCTKNTTPTPTNRNTITLSSSTPNANTHSEKINVPFKFSQHYTIKLANHYVADNNFTVGELIRQFVEYLHRRVEDGDEEVHAALFYHAEPLLYKCPTSHVGVLRQEQKQKELKNINVAHNLHGVKSYSNLEREGKKEVHVPFYQRKCVIDCAVYSRNRTMRCLGSCKLNKDSVLQVETHICPSHSEYAFNNVNSVHQKNNTAGNVNHIITSNSSGACCKSQQERKEKQIQNLEESQNRFVQSFFASLICAYHDEEIESHNINSGTCPQHPLFHLDPITDKHYKSLTHHNMTKSPSPSPCSRSKSVSLTPQPSNNNNMNSIIGKYNDEHDCANKNDDSNNKPQERMCTAERLLATPQLPLEPRPEQYEEKYDEAEVVNELQAAYSVICNRACVVHKPLVISDRFISYQVTGTHYCQNIHREHKSNNIYIVLDRKNGTWVQKCFDPDCASFRSAPQKLQTMQQHELE